MSAAAPTDPDTEEQLLAKARDGDEHAFGELIAPYRRELRAHGYRMLGSSDDAEDAVQDALLRAWRGLPRFEARSSLRTWLYRIATNVCLTRIERRPPRTLPIELGPATDPRHAEWAAVEAGWVEPFPDADLGTAHAVGPAGPEARYELRESIELAFVAALQHLPGTQRAVLVLRDVYGFSARETAEVLGTTVASVNSALQRARGGVDRRRPDPSQQVTLRALGDDGVRRLVRRYVDAWERGDVDAIVGLLTDDASFSMPPYPFWFAGRDDIGAFLPVGPLRQRWRLRPVAANGQVALAFYVWDAGRDRFVAHSIDVLTLRGDRIAGITAYLDLGADDVASFGLPGDLAAARAR